MRNLILILGDQLKRGPAAFAGFAAKQDTMWMARHVRNLARLDEARRKMIQKQAT